MKERLIGAAVLVVLAVWLIPWLLDGPDDLIEDGPVSLQLPVPQEQQVGQVRTETIDLRPRENDSPVIAADDSAIGRRADIRAVEASPVPAAVPSTSGDLPAVAGIENRPATETVDDRVVTGSNPATVQASQDAVSRANAESAAPAAVVEPARVESTPPAQPVSPAPRPAVAEASPSPSPAPVATGEWALQLGSFGDESNARRLADRVSSFGYEPQITNFRAGGRTMYRVRVGPHETRARAEAAASALSAHGFVAQVVTVD